MRNELIARYAGLGRIFRGACLAFVVSPAFAAPAAPALSASSTSSADSAAAMTESPAQTSEVAQTLMHLEEETLVLKARLKALDAQAQVTQRSSELNRLSAANERGDFYVRAVEGIGSTVYATLWSRDEGEFEVKAGDTLPNGFRIVSIGPGAVLARGPHGGTPMRLPMAIETTPADSQTGKPPVNGMGFPGIPSLPSLPRN